MPLFHIVGFINCPKIVIVCLPRVRQRCLSMCVLNVFDFTNIKLHKLYINFLCFTWFIPSIQLPKKSISVSPQGKVMLSLHVCVKNFNFANVKLHSFQQIFFCFMKLCHSKVQKDNFDVILEKYVVISVHVFSKLHIFTKTEIKIS